MRAKDALDALGVFAVVALATVIVLALIAIFTGAAVGAFLFIMVVVGGRFGLAGPAPPEGRKPSP